MTIKEINEEEAMLKARLQVLEHQRELINEQTVLTSKIKVGDEVVAEREYYNDSCGVVLRVEKANDYDYYEYNIMFCDGSTDWIGERDCRKTGKHFECIDDTLIQLRKESNNDD